MAVDALNTFQAAVTKTATFNGAAITIPNGTPKRGLVARVLYSAFSAATGTSTVTFSVDYASDGSTFTTLASAQPLTAAATAKSGEFNIPFITPVNSNFNTASAVRLTMTMSGAGVTTPSIVYNADMGDAFP